MVSPFFVFIFTVANIYVYCMFLVYLIILKNEKKNNNIELIYILISFLDLIQKNNKPQRSNTIQLVAMMKVNRIQ